MEWDRDREGSRVNVIRTQWKTKKNSNNLNLCETKYIMFDFRLVFRAITGVKLSVSSFIFISKNKKYLHSFIKKNK